MTEEMLKKDPKLILRTIHAYALNDLEVEDEIKELIIKNRELVKQVPPKEIDTFMKSIMVFPHPDVYIRIFKEVFFLLIPGLEKTYGFEQNNPWHIYDVFEHTLHVMENTEAEYPLRMAALFHDLGKPVVYNEETKNNEDGTKYKVGHFFNHHQVSSRYFLKYADKVQMPQEEKDLINKLIIYHDYHLSPHPEKIKQYAEDLGVDNIPLLFQLKRADNLAQNPVKTEPVLKELDEIEQKYYEVLEIKSKKKLRDTDNGTNN